MGVTWSQPKPVADATKIMLRASFPATAVLRAQLWNLWKQYKPSLKQDGFAISKYQNRWGIFYFADVHTDSYDLVTTDSGREPRYMVVFKNVYAEWKTILDELNSMESMTEQKAPTEETWFHDMEHDIDS